MGRAKGLTYASVQVTGNAQKRCTRRASASQAPAPPLALTAQQAAQELEQALSPEMRLSMTEIDAKRLEWMLASELPPYWALDNTLEATAATNNNAQLQKTLASYTATRLREEGHLLVQEGLQTEQELEFLLARGSQDKEVWAALRACNLIGVAQTLREAAAALSPEGSRTCDHLAKACVRCAREESAGVKGAYVDSLVTLVLSRGLTLPERAHERILLYENGLIAKHRRLVAGSTQDTSTTPVVMVDYNELVAVSLQTRLQGIDGNSMTSLDIVTLNRRSHKQMSTQHEQNCHSRTLTHELIHTYQGDALSPADSATLADIVLDQVLCEGATELRTSLLVGEQKDKYIDLEDYRRETAFVMVSALAACDNDPLRAQEIVEELACASHEQRAETAAKLLVGDETDASDKLKAAVWEYSNRNVEVYDRQQLRESAREIMTQIKSSTLSPDFATA